MVTSSQLFNDYQANKVAADNRYKGKQLLVTGTVASVNKGPFGGLVLRLATPNQFMSAMCRMKQYRSSPSSLSSRRASASASSARDAGWCSAAHLSTTARSAERAGASTSARSVSAGLVHTARRAEASCPGGRLQARRLTAPAW